MPAAHKPEVVLIAAVARNGAIGLRNELILRAPADQKHFREATMGCPVIMGHKTWDSLPARFRPLPGRRNLVLSRDAALKLQGAETTTSLDQALSLVQDAPRVFVIGGTQLYALALPQAHTLMLSEIDADLDGVGQGSIPRVGRERNARVRDAGDGQHLSRTRTTVATSPCIARQERARARGKSKTNPSALKIAPSLSNFR